MDPVYWARHFREPVRFADAIQQLANTDALLEVGPGTTLEILARQASAGAQQVVVSSLQDSSAKSGDVSCMLNALGRLWLAGIEPNWLALHAGEQRQRVSLPTYPFQRKRYWLEPAAKKNTRVSAENEHEEQTRTEGTFEMKNANDPVSSRQGRICSILASIFEDLSGLGAAEIPGSAAFLDLGFDSLLLTQVSQAVQGKLGVKITFRQLLDQQSSLDALAAYLDSNLSPDAFPAEPAPAAAPSPQLDAPMAPANPGVLETGSELSSLATDSSLSERIVKEQLRTMSQLISAQLEVLKGQGVPSQPSVTQASNGRKAYLSATPAATKAPASLPSDADSVASKQEFKAFGPYKPVQQGLKGRLTARQEKYLTALIARYSKRTAESKRLTQAYRHPLADPRVVAGFRSQWKEIVYPIVTERSSGSELWDVDGNEYIDILNGYGPTMFGHPPKVVTDVVAGHLSLRSEIGPPSPL